jgi:hypothetical protein
MTTRTSAARWYLNEANRLLVARSSGNPKDAAALIEQFRFWSIAAPEEYRKLWADLARL